jgi:hypothetical protein
MPKSNNQSHRFTLAQTAGRQTPRRDHREVLQNIRLKKPVSKNEIRLLLLETSTKNSYETAERFKLYTGLDFS